MATMNQLQQANSPLDRVRVAFGRTLNLGDYESSRIDVAYESNINPGEAPGEAIARVTKVVQSELKTQVTIIRNKILKGQD